MAKLDQTQHRDRNVDFIRAVSILYIVGFWHLFNYTNAFPLYNNQITYHMAIFFLGLFVFLSGYLLGKKDLIFGKSQFFDFYKRRLIRIYPPFLMAVVTFELADLATTDVLLKSAFLLSIFILPPPYTLWFVVMIIAYYLLTPFAIVVRNNKIAFLSFLVTLILLSTYIDQLVLDFDNRFIIYLFPFFAGIYFAKFDAISINMIAFISAIAVISFFLDIGFNLKHEKSYLTALFVGSSSLSIFLIIRHFKIDLLYNDVIEKISYASYFMYLFHRPIYKTALDVYSGVSELEKLIFLVLFCLPAIIISSWIAQFLYDKSVDYFTHRQPNNLHGPDLVR